MAQMPASLSFGWASSLTTGSRPGHSTKEEDLLRARLRRERAIRLEAERLGEEATERLYRAAEELDQKNVELLIAADRAQAASRAKTAFLRQIRHELRTPLNTIGPMLHTLGEMVGEANADALDFVREAQQAYQDLAGTLERLLEVAEIGALAEPVARPFSLSALIRTVSDDFHAAAQEAGADLVAISEESDPDVHDSVIGDPGRISRALSALVKNSIQYAPGDCVEIATSATRGEGSIQMVTFSVDDGGPGLGDDEVSMIREAFSRSGNVLSGPSSGLGLGLTLASALVESLEGQIDISPSSRLGLRVSFTIPLIVGDGTPEHEPQSQLPLGS